MSEQRKRAVKASPSARELAGRSLADYATDVLRDRLIVLDIPPGTPMNDETIGAEMGIGRTPVREAIKRLEAEHLVSVYPRRGTFAAMVDITDLSEITEIRVQLEPIAAARAARFASPETRVRLRELADTIEAVDLSHGTNSDLMRYDLDVHRSVYAANGNRHLEEVLITYDNLATRIWCMVLDRLPEVGGHIADHISLLRSVADGRSDEAADIAREHVIAFERLVKSVL